MIENKRGLKLNLKINVYKKYGICASMKHVCQNEYAQVWGCMDENIV